jgi:hypothetical protein
VASPSARDEARINDALKKLCEEFHLGMVQGDEYRSRRRRLLENWADRDTTTAPGMRARAAAPAPAKTAAAPPPPAAAGAKNLVAVVIAIVVAIILAAAAVMLLRKPAAHPPSATTGAAPGVSREHLAQIRQAAVDFVARNQWEPPNLDEFLGRWHGLSPAEQALARQEPSLRSLRYELQQNIKLAAQMAGAGADEAVKQRLDRLSGFARELEGATP